MINKNESGINNNIDNHNNISNSINNIDNNYSTINNYNSTGMSSSKRIEKIGRQIPSMVPLSQPLECKKRMGLYACTAQHGRYPSRGVSTAWELYPAVSSSNRNSISSNSKVPTVRIIRNAMILMEGRKEGRKEERKVEYHLIMATRSMYILGSFTLSTFSLSLDCLYYINTLHLDDRKVWQIIRKNI